MCWVISMIDARTRMHTHTHRARVAVMSRSVTLVKGKNNMIGISIGGGAPLCPVLYIVQVKVIPMSVYLPTSLSPVLLPPFLPFSLTFPPTRLCWTYSLFTLFSIPFLFDWVLTIFILLHFQYNTHQGVWQVFLLHICSYSSSYCEQASPLYVNLVTSLGPKMLLTNAYLMLEELVIIHCTSVTHHLNSSTTHNGIRPCP